MRALPFPSLTPSVNGRTPRPGTFARVMLEGALALALIDDRLFDAGIDGGLVGWLHDEFIVDVREDQAARAAEILKQSMIDGFAETFPGAPLNGLVEPHIGANWGAAKAAEIRTASGATQRPQEEPDYVTALRTVVSGARVLAG